MGLDNGFYVRSNRRRITREDLPQELHYPFEKDYGDDVEVIYHRKDWGWRNSIMKEFGWKDVNMCDDIADMKVYLIETPAQVLKLIEVTASWFNEEIWEEEGNSILEYESARKHLVEDIINYSILYSFMQQNPDVFLEFYDSY